MKTLPFNYAERDLEALDKAGSYYTRHVMALTSENLYNKSDIAAELAWRDMEIDRLKADVKVMEGFADLWYYAEEHALEFETIVATYIPSRWMNELANRKRNRGE